MVEIGYTLSSEEFAPGELVELAVRAEEVGFRFAMISDHFHPWVDRQGQSPFVWSVLGAIATATDRLTVGTGVTCPTIRIHPAIVAQAAATTASLMPGRFYLGLGSGENLNEHIVGARWPPASVRLSMLEEAIEVIRLLWKGGSQSHRGDYYTVDRARIYTLPAELPPILVAASGDKAIRLAGEAGDGLVGLEPDKDLIQKFDDAGGAGKPTFGQLHVCWAEDENRARRTAHQVWPNSGLSGPLFTEIATPELFELACEPLREEDVADSVLCSSDPEEHRAAIQKYIDAGFDHVYVHQIGSEQEGFFTFYQKEILRHFT